MKKTLNNGLLAIFVLTVMMSSVYIVNNIDIDQSRKNTASVSDTSGTFHNGLVAYWKFDGEDGVNIKDSSTAGNNFKLTQAQFAPGKVGQAVDLIKSFGAIPHSESLSIDKEITISFWLYPRSFPKTYYPIFSKFEQGKNLETINYAAYFWGESTAASNRGFDFWAGVSDSYWGPISTRRSAKLNEWQHIALSYTASESGKLYINGQLIDSNFSLSATKGFLSKNAGNIRIGGADALLDELMIFNRALSDDEIRKVAFGDEQQLIFNSISNRTISVGTKIDFTVQASCSVSCSNVVYSLENAPDGAILNSSTGGFEWTPSGNQSGDFEIRFNAVSGSLQASTRVDIRVTPLPTSVINDCQSSSNNKCIDFGSDKEGESGITYNSDALSAPVTADSINYRSILPKKRLKFSIPSFSTNGLGGITEPFFLEIKYKDSVKVEDGRKDPVFVYSFTNMVSNNPLVIKRELFWVASLGEKGDGLWKTASKLFQDSPTPLIRDINGQFKFEIYNSKDVNIDIDFISLKTLSRSEMNSYLETKRNSNGYVITSIPEKTVPSSNLTGKSVVIFARDYMRPIFDWSKPSEEEIGKPIKGLGFLDEVETLNIGLYSDTGISNVGVEVSELVNSDGQKISPESKLFIIENANHRLGPSGTKQYNNIPDYLKPFSSFSISGGTSKRVVFRVPIPSNSSGGVYTGVVRIKKDGNILGSAPINLKVVPMVLNRPNTVHVMFHDPYNKAYALNFSESLKIYKDSGTEPWIVASAADIKLIDKASVKYDVSTFARKIDEMLAGGALKRGTPMVQIAFYPWDKVYTDMVGTINGKAVGASDAEYISLKTPDLYDRLSNQEFIRAFKSVLSSIDDVATSRGLKFIYGFTDEPGGKIDRLILSDRLHTYTREIGYKTWATGAPSIPTRLNQGGYTGSVSEMPPLSGLTDYNIVDTADGYYTTQFSFLRFPVYNRFAHGIYSYARNWKFLNAYALGDSNQDPFDDFDYNPNGGYDNAGVDYILGYTTLDGGWLPTMSYEGLREGIRDDSYLSTLESLVNNSGNGPAVLDAKNYLDAIKRRVGALAWYKDFFWKVKPYGFYDLILSGISSRGEDDFEFFSDMREQIANHILNIKGIKISSAPPANIPNDPNSPNLPRATPPGATPTPMSTVTPVPPVNNQSQTNLNSPANQNANYVTPGTYPNTKGNYNQVFPKISTIRPNADDYPLLNIPETSINHALPELPSWLDIMRSLIIEVFDTVKTGVKNTIGLIKGSVN